MIFINKSKFAPAIIYRNGANVNKLKNEVETKKLCDEFDADPPKYINGQPFEFNNSIFGDPIIKDSLKYLQHGKCCFCESKVPHIANGDVEHFRPKGGYRSVKGEALKHPGYYWLAYDWDNLLFSCQICNERNKENLFPLLNEAQRAINHKQPIIHENPVFVNPAKEDPEICIGFRDEYAYGKDPADRGKRTIEALGINFEKDFGLVEERRDHLNLFKTERKIFKLADEGKDIDLELLNEALETIRTAKSEKARYASMIRENFIDIF